VRRAVAALIGSITLATPEPQLIYVTTVETETIIVERSWQDMLDVETPLINSLLTAEDWEEIDRQSDCLYEYLRQHVGYEITLERVIAAGDWTDQLGGACAVIGADGDVS
jgi:hypothetical protein